MKTAADPRKEVAAFMAEFFDSYVKHTGGPDKVIKGVLANIKQTKALQNYLVQSVFEGRERARDLQFGVEPQTPRLNRIMTKIPLLSKETCDWWSDQTDAVQNTLTRKVITEKAKELGMVVDPKQMIRASAKKQAGNGGQDTLWALVDRRAYAKTRQRLLKEDSQSGELLGQIAREFIEIFDLSEKEQYALNYYKNILTNHKKWDAGMIRNYVFKAADMLGISLPSGHFASSKNKKASDGSNILNMVVGLEGMRSFDGALDVLLNAEDQQAADLFSEVGSVLAKRFAVDSDVADALDRFRWVVDNAQSPVVDIGLIRNNVFKAANSLNIKLPSHNFASQRKVGTTMHGEKELRSGLIRLAAAKPEFRSEILKVLKKTAAAGDAVLEERMKIQCIDHPEWGTWVVLQKATGVPTAWEIRGRSGERVLFESEFKRFWKTVDDLHTFSKKTAAAQWMLVMDEEGSHSMPDEKGPTHKGTVVAVGSKQDLKDYAEDNGLEWVKTSYTQFGGAWVGGYGEYGKPHNDFGANTNFTPAPAKPGVKVGDKVKFPGYSF